MLLRCLTLVVILLLPLPGLAGHNEVKPLLLPLQGAVRQAEAEISGLAWHRGRLLLLPQFPDFTSPERTAPAALFAIERKDILSFLATGRPAPLPHQEIAVQGLDACWDLPGFEGFEAIAVQDDRAWLLVEARHKGRMHGWLLQGIFTGHDTGPGQLHLDASTAAPLEMPMNLRNAAFETLVLDANSRELLAVFEGNGKNINPSPWALRFTTDSPLSQQPGKAPFPTVEYRITDATTVTRQEGRRLFWGLNYFWPGDAKRYDPAPDSLVRRHGQGPTHARSDAVERIVQFQLTSGGVTLTDTPPLQLSLGFLPRNWEGLVRLEDKEQQGFLLATDKYPGTLLGFVPLP